MQPTAAASPPLPVAKDTGFSDTVESSRQLIDRITYLASLASRFEDVDPMMDTLRAETSKWDTATPLAPDQLKRLQTLENNLKYYLINKDPVRSFTAESLEERLAARERKAGISSAARSSIFIVLISSLASALCYLPFLPLTNRQFLAIPLFFVILHMGIAWLYLTALKNINDEVRKAFKLVAVAAILFGLAFSGFVVTAAFPQYFDNSVPATYIQTWLVASPYLFIYFGMRMYAGQLGIKTWVSKLPLIVAVWVALMAARVLLFSVPNDPHFYGWASAAISFTFFAFLSVLLVRQIRKVVTSTYAKPMTWLYIYLIVNGLASISANLPADGEGEHVYVLMVIFGVPVQLLLLVNAYSFKKELSK